jgi:uncharacterized lipoprotein YddW (UPF0748 family)
MKWYLALLAMLVAPLQAAGWNETVMPVPEPAREFRGAWVTSVYNLDWPSKPGLSQDQQQAELRTLLDAAANLRLNAVLLQVRPGGDALYASKLEPWSAVLTGKSGGNPGYDPLAFAVEEAHRRGLELHTWFNPFRAKVGKTALDPLHWTVRHPEWVRGKDSHVFMDPGLPEVQAHVLAVFRDVVGRYDIDGIHIDDYFYPYPVFGPDKQRLEVLLGDEAQWQKENGEKDLSLADWRRNNINRFVKSFYGITKSVKPAVRVGISPFGIWQPGIPAGIEAMVNAYDHLYGDSRRWLQEGWCDYLAPQLYWPIQPAKQSFTALMEWWQSQSKGRPVWPGMAVDRVASTREPVLPLTELNDQMAVMRRVVPAPGSVMWRIRFLTSDARGVATRLRENCYQDRALAPAAAWLGAEAPGKPQVRLETGSDGLKLTWTAGTGAPVRWWVVQTRREGKWTLEPPMFRDRSGGMIKEAVEAVALRTVSASGMAGPPSIWTATPP